MEANEKSPNKDAGMYLGVYAVLFVIQLVGNVGGLWYVIVYYSGLFRRLLNK